MAAEQSGAKGTQEITAKYKSREEHLKQEASKQFEDLKARAQAEIATMKANYDKQVRHRALQSVTERCNASLCVTE